MASETESKEALPTKPPRLHVTVETPGLGIRDYIFEKPFRIGRIHESDICIKNEYVSRTHAEAIFENGGWCLHDLNSSNGLYVDNQRVRSVPISRPVNIRLGLKGPAIRFEAESSAERRTRRPGTGTMVARYVSHYFRDSAANPEAGEHTMMVRKAFEVVQGQQRKRHRAIVLILCAVVLLIGVYALREHLQTQKQKTIAENLFYAMKSLDVEIASDLRQAQESQDPRRTQQAQGFESKRRQMERDYNSFLSSLHTYSSKITPQEQLVFRIARVFGECELVMPPDFLMQINLYIKKWQSSDRLARSIRAANENGYTPVIARELLAEGLPPQFFYLALQESNFDPYTSGPVTRKGIAKGMWQFIPETALKYGLHLGPLLELRRPDPGDDRHHWQTETKAAAKYLNELYSTDAQASGLLVMASYNWGEDYVLPLVRKMPANPRDRNFWLLLTKYRDKVPQETYDYVFYIASAAVIGENPRLFGFDFDNPLAALETTSAETHSGSPILKAAL